MNSSFFDLIMQYGPRIARFLAMVAAAWWGVAYIEKKIKMALSRVYPDELRLGLVGRLFSYCAYFVIFAALLHEFGVDISALLGAAGIIGLAIGYASQTSMANVISGLFLMVEKPFELDDILMVGNEEGRVTSVNLFSVTLCTYSGTMVRIPNEQLLKNTFINLTRFPARRHTISLKIDYNEDPSMVMAIIEKVIKESPYCLNEPKPYIALTELSGHYLDIFVGVWGTQENITEIKRSLLIDMRTAFEHAGIKMAIYKTSITDKS